MKPHDVLVIGGGAAGSSAAFHLASKGKSVCILEKEEEIVLKSCSGGIASSVQSLFPFDLSSTVEETIQRVEFTWNLGDPVIANLKEASPFWIVKRETLDSLITSKAIAAGADLIKPFFVDSLERKDDFWLVKSNKGQELKGKAVVIADGSSSKWPSFFRLGPISAHFAPTTFVRLNGKGNLQKGSLRFDFGLVHHGFTWAFPLREGINVGVGTFIGKNADNNDKVLQKMLPNLGFDPNDGFKQKKQLRVWNGHHDLHAEGLLVVGDAASLCDPFLAEGLRPAIISGNLAANSLNEWLEGREEDLSSYSNSIRNNWGNSMAWGKRIAQVFYRFPKVGYQLGVKRPTAPQRIAQILSGEMGYEDIAKRVIKRLLTRN